MKAISLILGCALSVAVLGGCAARTTPDHPADFSGIWQHVGSIRFDPTIRGGLGGAQDRPPYNAEYQARYQEILETRARGEAVDDLAADCQPPGLVRMMNGGYFEEILQTPGQITIHFEALTQVRRIYTDGRPLPEDLDPAYYGYSRGHWEGGTLVVETTGLVGGLNLNDQGAPLGEELRVTERFWLEDPDTLKIEFTVHNPDAMTGPYTAVKTWKRAPKDIYIMEYYCVNNRNDTTANGTTGVDLQN